MRCISLPSLSHLRGLLSCLALLLVIAVPARLGAAEWSDWRVLSSQRDVVLEYSYKSGRELNNQETTRVQWRITNNTPARIWGAVKDKEYTMADGRVRTPLDEGRNVAAHSSGGFPSDLVQGRVVRVAAVLSVSDPM